MLYEVCVTWYSRLVRSVEILGMLFSLRRCYEREMRKPDFDERSVFQESRLTRRDFDAGVTLFQVRLLRV